jgi:hypothetical protein
LLRLDSGAVKTVEVATVVRLGVGVAVGSRVILGKGVAGAGVGVGWTVGQSAGPKGDEAAAVGWASPPPQLVIVMAKSQGMSEA